MYKHPMLSVKEAAAMLGCDERWIRERLNQGQLKGEKKNIGAKEKWFVYKGEIDAALARKGVFPSAPSDSPPPEGVALQSHFAPPIEPTDQATRESGVSGAFIEGNARPIDDEDPKSWLGKEREAIKAIAEEIVKPLMETIQKQTSALDAKELIIQDQKKRLLLLPDLEARKRELENKIDGERKAAQLQYDRAMELEKQLEDERKLQEAEIEKIKIEKEDEAKAIKEQLNHLTDKLHKLEQPWWKRWLSPSAD